MQIGGRRGGGSLNLYECAPKRPSPSALADYQPPSHLIDTVHLDFDLQPSATRVRATLAMRRNGESDQLVLDGEGLKTLSVKVDGQPFAYDAGPENLTLTGLPGTFTLDTEVEIDPAGNTALMGLYMSAGGSAPSARRKDSGGSPGSSTGRTF